MDKTQVSDAFTDALILRGLSQALIEVYDSDTPQTFEGTSSLIYAIEHYAELVTDALNKVVS